MLRANKYNAVLNIRDWKLFSTVQEAALEYGTTPSIISTELYDRSSDFRRVRRVYRVTLSSGKEYICYSSKERGFMRLVENVFEYIKVGKMDKIEDITLAWYLQGCVSIKK